MPYGAKHTGNHSGICSPCLHFIICKRLWFVRGNVGICDDEYPGCVFHDNQHYSFGSCVSAGQENFATSRLWSDGSSELLRFADCCERAGSCFLDSMASDLAVVEEKKSSAPPLWVPIALNVSGMLNVRQRMSKSGRFQPNAPQHHCVAGQDPLNGKTTQYRHSTRCPLWGLYRD